MIVELDAVAVCDFLVQPCLLTLPGNAAVQQQDVGGQTKVGKLAYGAHSAYDTKR